MSSPWEIVVTGASGFVGRRLVVELERQGHTVYAYSTKTGDLSRGDFDFEAADHVIHLAGKTFVPDSWNNPPSYYQVNVLGTAHVAEVCRRRKARLTLCSSYVYGRPRQLPIPEDHPLEPFNPYGHSKILAEQVAQYYQTAFQLPVTIVRPFNLYGPGQDARFLIPTLISQVRSDSPNIEVADLRPRRDYIYIDDFIDLLILTLHHSPGTYNAGSGHSASIAEVFELISRASGTSKPLLSREEERPNEVLDVVADVSKAERELGWKPQTTLADGLAKMVVLH